MQENEFIEIINASENNLKNISLKLPRNKLIVVTGLSGSGKSSLAFDTLYAEGQRRYVESLSAYARQFMGRIKKPLVEQIKGLPPAIAIEQKTTVSNPRSTVGTATEIYDYMRLFFARVGKTYSPVSGIEVKKHAIEDVVQYTLTLPKDTSILILSPLDIKKRKIDDELDFLQRQGFRRVEIFTGNAYQTEKIEELLENKELQNKIVSFCLVIDRLRTSEDDDTLSRIADSVQTAFFEGSGTCKIKAEINDKAVFEDFSNVFEADGIIFNEPNLNMFNFNNPLGSCPTCNGFGTTIGISEDLVVPNKSISIFDDAIACWHGEKLQYYKHLFIEKSAKYKFPIHKAYKDLNNKEKDLLWNGKDEIIGINQFFDLLASEAHKIQNRVLIARYRGKTICPVCNGSRLRKEVSYIKIDGKAITDLVNLQINHLRDFFENIHLTEIEQKISKRLLTEIRQRIDYLCNVGLDYLTLNRTSTTLSGGEMQRINLSTALGSSLIGSLYVLDEPTIGLHPRDTERLMKVLRNLQDLGNTVLIVEHEQHVIENADWIVDLGPLAGAKGGEIVFEGTFDKILSSNCLTGQYLSNKKYVGTNKDPRKPSDYKGYIYVNNASQNNLKNVSIKIPLGLVVAITGVSGSGKSSLIKDVVYPALIRNFEIFTHALGRVDSVNIDDGKINNIEFIDQNPIGRSTRSNPVTYTKSYDDIRKLFTMQPAAKINGFTASHFSFNTDGGRCEECQGDGFIKIEMQFMADVTMVCESCNGKRFKDEILEVTFHGKNIYDVLEMTIDEAIEFFTFAQTDKHSPASTLKAIVDKLSILSNVGLGYVKLGQSTSTLSGGESQRLKLANFMATENSSKKTLFIFDEPTTGLHFDDVNKLLKSFNELANRGHSIIFIEHNLDMIKNADWVIDLGPEGGEKGGNIVFEGTPHDLTQNENSYTGKFLKQLTIKG